MGEVPFRSLQPFDTEVPGAFSRVYRDAHSPVVVKEVVRLVQDSFGIPEIDALQDQDYSRAFFTIDVIYPAQKVLDPSSGLGEFIPKTMFVWGKNEEGKQRGFIVMQEVMGVDIADVTKLQPATAAKLDRLVAASVRLSQGYGGVHLDIMTPDATLKNIIIGTVDDKPEEAPYMIDLYPLEFLQHHKRAIEKRLLINMREQYDYPFEQTAEAMRVAHEWW